MAQNLTCKSLNIIKQYYNPLYTVSSDIPHLASTHHTSVVIRTSDIRLKNPPLLHPLNELPSNDILSFFQQFRETSARSAARAGQMKLMEFSAGFQLKP